MIMKYLDPLISAVLGRLSERERFLVTSGTLAAFLLIGLLTAAVLGSKSRQVRHRVAVKSQQLQEVLDHEGAYKEQERARQKQLASLQRQHVQLVSHAEQAAKDAGVQIDQLQPEEGEAAVGGVRESRLSLRVADLSADRLQAFVQNMERGDAVVQVRRLQVRRPYKKDTAEANLTVVTYRVEGAR